MDLLTSQFYFPASRPTRQCISVTLSVTVKVNWQPFKLKNASKGPAEIQYTGLTMHPFQIHNTMVLSGLCC